jgi:predicted RNA-binding Zn ribbon-like protein
MTLPAWLPSGHQTKPAPEPLLLVQAFVNTKDLELGADLLSEPGPANDWLHLASLLGAGVTVGRADLEAARAAREDIRALLTRNGHGGGFTGGELGALRATASAARPQLAVGPDGQVRLEAGPDDRLGSGLAQLLLIIRDAQRDGTWRRLKVCGKADCGWAFYDRSHSRAGTWCDMASCGNLIKNRNLRARRGAQAQPAPSAGPAAH